MVKTKTGLDAYESGKVNVGVEVQDPFASPPPPVPVIECDESCMVAINDCLEEGCSVDALIKLDDQLATDEKRILQSVQELTRYQKTSYTEENKGTLAWLQNFLNRSGSLRAQLATAKTIKDDSFIKQLVRAAAVSFGGARSNDYPKVGVAAYAESR